MRTGFPALDNKVAMTTLKSGGASIPVGTIKNPTIPGVGYENIGGRSTVGGERRPVHIDDITNCYLIDGIVRQGIDKYAELISQIHLVGEPKPREYLERRLMMLSLSTKPPIMWTQILTDMIRDCFKYSNSFIVKARVKSKGKGPMVQRLWYKDRGSVAGLFNVSVESMIPDVNDSGNITNWIQCPPQHAGFYDLFRAASKDRIKQKSLDIEDVCHFSYCRQPGAIWGLPTVAPLVEDVKIFREMEGQIATLLEKSLNPIYHHEVPSGPNTPGVGRRTEVERAGRTYQQMDTAGMIVTPPGHKINVIGAESHAIRAEGYLGHFLRRIFTGLGVSELIMGQGSTPYGAADAMLAMMLNRAQFCQRELSQQIEFLLFNELLYEGGFDPYNNPDHVVRCEFEELDKPGRIKYENHLSVMYSTNTLARSEVMKRMHMQKDPLVGATPPEKDFYVDHVSIKEIDAKNEGAIQIAAARPAPQPGASKASAAGKSRPRASTKNSLAFSAYLEDIPDGVEETKLEWHLSNLHGVLLEGGYEEEVAREIMGRVRELYGSPNWMEQCRAWADLRS